MEGKTVKRNLKRNIVIAAVLVFVGAAVYLNWSYNSRWGTADAAMAAAEDAAMAAADEEYLAASASANASSIYFDKARLTRQSARDDALQLLEMACGEADVSQEVIDESMRQINTIAERNLQENLLENELLAKNFTDCVAFVSDEGVTVAVPAPMEGLTDVQVAQITEAVLANTDFDATALNIVEVRN